MFAICILIVHHYQLTSFRINVDGSIIILSATIKLIFVLLYLWVFELGNVNKCFEEVSVITVIKLQQSACLEDNVLLQMESSCTQCD